MTDYAYGPGGWTALAHGGRAALLDPAIDAAAVRRIWDSLASGGSLESWLEVLAGNGLASLPAFGLVEPSDDGVRVVVRGAVVALVEDYDISAGNMRTWREHVAAAGAPVVLQVEAGEAGYPLVGGMVLASVLHVGDVVVADDGDQVVEPAEEAAAVAAVAPVEDVAEGDDEVGTDGDEAAAVDVVAEAAPVEEPVVEGSPLDEPVADEAPADEASADEASADETPSDEAPSDDEQPSEEPVVEEEAPASDAPADEVNPDEDTADDPVDGDVEVSAEAPADAPAEQPWGVPGEAVAEPVEDFAADAQPQPAAEQPWSLPPAQAAPAPQPWAVPAPAAPVASQWGPPVPAAAEQAPQTAAEPVAEPEASAEAPQPEQGDHDGFTIRATDIPERDPVDMTIAPAPEEGQDGPAAPVLQLQLSTGQQVELDRAVLVGRAPESSRFGFGETPRLVTVPSPQQDISRTHVEIKLEGDHVLVTDLRSTNGTVVVLPGAPPRRLHPGESVPVPVGTVVDLGDGVTAVVTAPGTPQQY